MKNYVIVLKFEKLLFTENWSTPWIFYVAIHLYEVTDYHIKYVPKNQSRSLKYILNLFFFSVTFSIKYGCDNFTESMDLHI